MADLVNPNDHSPLARESLGNRPADQARSTINHANLAVKHSCVPLRSCALGPSSPGGRSRGVELTPLPARVYSSLQGSWPSQPMMPVRAAGRCAPPACRGPARPAYGEAVITNAATGSHGEPTAADDNPCRTTRSRIRAVQRLTEPQQATSGDGKVVTGVQGVAGSNPAAPTIFRITASQTARMAAQATA
jgi:hypothetical protein